MMYLAGARIPKELLAYIENRWTQEALDYWRSSYGLVVVAYETVWGYSGQGETFPVACAAVAFVDEVWKYGVTVTHTDYRRKGYGSEALRRRLAIQNERQPLANFRAIVALDNVASVRMCASAGLNKVEDSREAQRRSGPFIQLLLTEGEKHNA